VRVRNVLFVCLGNICRSPMAAAFANRYGSDIMKAQSAGIAPAINTTPLTRKVMLEKNIDLGDHMPQPLAYVDFKHMDLIVNMSGYKIPGVYTIEWEVPDPMGRDLATFRSVRDQIEMMVMQMILKMRMGKM
jgi:arsenate reductase